MYGLRSRGCMRDRYAEKKQFTFCRWQTPLKRVFHHWSRLFSFFASPRSHSIGPTAAAACWQGRPRLSNNVCIRSNVRQPLCLPGLCERPSGVTPTLRPLRIRMPALPAVVESTGRQTAAPLGSRTRVPGNRPHRCGRILSTADKRYTRGDAPR